METNNQSNESLLAAIEHNPAAAQAIAALAGGASAAEVIAALINQENTKSKAEEVPAVDAGQAPCNATEAVAENAETSADAQASDAAPEAQQPDVLPVAAGDGVPVASPSFLSEISCDFWENF